MIAWLRRLFCKHDFLPFVAAYAAPLPSFSSYNDLTALRALAGLTTVLSRCKKCGATERHELLGKRVAPPSQAELRALKGGRA